MGPLPFIHADGKRFELLVRGYRTLVFKTSSLGRSDNHPEVSILRGHTFRSETKNPRPRSVRHASSSVASVATTMELKPKLTSTWLRIRVRTLRPHRVASPWPSMAETKMARER